MCGRYTLLTPQQELEIRAIVKEAEERVRQRNSENVSAKISTTDVFPKALAPILVPKNGSYIAYPGFWGFTGWSTKSKRKGKNGEDRWNKPNTIFNTRDDTATKEHPNNIWEELAIESLRKRRCIIPTSGFYETQYSYNKKPGEKPKEKGNLFFFDLPNSEITYIAGIWHNETHADSGEKWLHFSMMTTEGNDSVRKIHGRMPVVLQKSELMEWLYGDYLDLLDREDITLESRIA